MSTTKKEKQPDTEIGANYIAVTFGYNSYVMNHQDGMRVLQAMEKAEKIEMDYGGKINKIEPLTPEHVKFTFVNIEAFKNRKVELLLLGGEDES